MDRVWVRTMLGHIADLGRKYLPRRSQAPPSETAIALCRDLLSGQGEASGVALAREVIDLYLRASEVVRTAFFESVASEFVPDEEAIVAAARDFITTRSPEAYLRLAAAVERPTQELFRRLNMAPGATGVIVKMREHLLGLVDDRPCPRRASVRARGSWSTTSIERRTSSRTTKPTCAKAGSRCPLR
jgi:malonyl-CoA decarboxylase